MKIEITRIQEVVDDIPKKPEYRICVTRYFGSGEFRRERHEMLGYDFSIEDIQELRDRLNKDFPLT